MVPLLFSDLDTGSDWGKRREEQGYNDGAQWKLIELPNLNLKDFIYYEPILLFEPQKASRVFGAISDALGAVHSQKIMWIECR